MIVVYIDRNALTLYRGDREAVGLLRIPETIVRDLEVLDKDTLYGLISGWIQGINISASDLVCILGQSVYYAKELSGADKQATEDEALAFFESIPFDSIHSRIYSAEKGKRAIAVNAALCDAIQKAFTLQGFHVRAIVPVGVMGNMSTKQGLDGELGSWTVKNMELVAHQSIVAGQPQGEAALEGGTAHKKSQLPLLLGFLGILVLFLIIMLMVPR